MTDYNAALGLAQLRDMETAISRRRELAALFAQSLARTRHRLVTQGGEGEPGYWAFPVSIASSVKDVRAYAKKKEVETELAFEGSLLAKGFVPEGVCPNARSMAMRCLLFPLHQRIGAAAAEKICKVLCDLAVESFNGGYMPERAGRVLIIANLEKDSAATTADCDEILAVHARLRHRELLLPRGPRRASRSSRGLRPRHIPGRRRDRPLRGAGGGAPRHTDTAGQPRAPRLHRRDRGRAEWPSAIAAWARGELPVSERLMLAVEAWRDGERVASFLAMNDATISAQGIAKLIGFGIRLGSVHFGALSGPTASSSLRLPARLPTTWPPAGRSSTRRWRP